MCRLATSGASMTDSHTPAPTVVAGIRTALVAHPPFNAMAEADLQRLIRGMQLRYFAPGETIVAPTATRPDHCHVIRQGLVRSERAVSPGERGISREFAAGQMFPLAAMLARRGTFSVYRAIEDTFCFTFTAELFDRLVDDSAVFADFCRRQLDYLVEQSRSRLQAEYAAAITEGGGLATPLRDLSRDPVISCSADTGIGDALRSMEASRIGAMPVIDGEGRPVGIFTRQDVIGRVVLAGRALTAPIRDVMSSPVLTLPGEATAGDAALLLARKGVRHVVIVGEGRLQGIVSERDLFALQRRSSHDLATAIRRATDLATLERCAQDIRALSHSLVAQGVAARELTREIGASVIHNLITSRAVPELVTERGGTPIRSCVGHSNVKALMAETGAIFGGEHSAHYYFRDFWGADSGMLAALHVLAALGEQSRSLSELMANYERYEASGELNFTVTDAQACIDAVVRSFGGQIQALDHLDGVTVDLGSGTWFNLRTSNTEPLLRLNVEARGKDTVTAVVEQIAAHIRRTGDETATPG